MDSVTPCLGVVRKMARKAVAAVIYPSIQTPTTVAAEAFPLAWPLGTARTPARSRERARFSKRGSSGYNRPVTTAEGRDRVIAALDAWTPVGSNYRIPERTVVISTNVEPARKGRGPRGGTPEPSDPGVAVYFELDGRPYCLPCDTWDTVGGNLAAVAAHLDAMRGIERWGVGSTEQQFRGYAALPAPGETTGNAWWNVLGVEMDADVDTIRRAYRDRAKETHPDAQPNKDATAFHAVQDALSQGLAARSAVHGVA